MQKKAEIKDKTLHIYENEIWNELQRELKKKTYQLNTNEMLKEDLVPRHIMINCWEVLYLAIDLIKRNREGERRSFKWSEMRGEFISWQKKYLKNIAWSPYKPAKINTEQQPDKLIRETNKIIKTVCDISDNVIIGGKTKDGEKEEYRLTISRVYIEDIDEIVQLFSLETLKSAKRDSHFPEIKTVDDILPRLGVSFSKKDLSALYISKSVSQKVEEIVESINRKKVVVIIGEPGIGKSTILYLVWKELQQREIVSRWLTSEVEECKDVLLYDDLDQYIDLYYKRDLDDFCKAFDKSTAGLVFTCRNQEYEDLVLKSYILKKKLMPVAITKTNEQDMKGILRDYAGLKKIRINKDAIEIIIEKADGVPLYTITVIDYALERELKNINVDFAKELPHKFSEFIQEIIYYQLKFKTYLTIVKMLANKSIKSHSGMYGVPIDYIKRLQPMLSKIFNESDYNLPLFHLKFRYLMRYEYIEEVPQTVRLPHQFWKDVIYSFQPSLFPSKNKLSEEEDLTNPIYRQLTELYNEIFDLRENINKTKEKTFKDAIERLEKIENIGRKELGQYICLYRYCVDKSDLEGVFSSHAFKEGYIKKAMQSNSLRDVLVPLAPIIWYKVLGLTEALEMRTAPNEVCVMKNALSRCKIALHIDRNPNYYRIAKYSNGIDDLSNFFKDWLTDVLNICMSEIKQSPKKASWYCTMGLTLRFLDRTPEAVENIERAMNLKIDPWYYKEIGDFFIDIGDVDRGLECIDVYLDNLPEKWHVWEAKADYLLKYKEDILGSAECIRKALEITYRPHLWIKLGGYYEYMKCFNDAIDCYENAITSKLVKYSKDKGCGIYHRLVACYYNIENFEKALENLNRITEIDPGDQEAWKLMNHIYKKLGERL